MLNFLRRVFELPQPHRGRAAAVLRSLGFAPQDGGTFAMPQSASVPRPEHVAKRPPKPDMHRYVPIKHRPRPAPPPPRKSDMALLRDTVRRLPYAEAIAFAAAIGIEPTALSRFVMGAAS